MAEEGEYLTAKFRKYKWAQAVRLKGSERELGNLQCKHLAP